MDVEDGYGDDPESVADYVARLPVDGINLEDSTDGRPRPPAAHAEKVAAIKRRRPELFVNARVDTYWFGQDATVAAAVARAAAYIEAGADGIFVPGAADPAVIGELAAAIPVPLNVLPVVGMTVGELAELGVRRVSTGSLPHRAAAAAIAVRDGEPVPESIPYPDFQAWLVEYAR